MIIKAKAPLRINFAGGGTDVEPYASDYGGFILSAAVNLYGRATCGLSEYVPKNEVERILTDIRGNSVKVTSDVYIDSGLGGSSACIVAGLKTMYPELDKEQIARMAFYLERNSMSIAGGIQDQYCAAYGGLLYLTVTGEKTYLETLQWPDIFSRLLVLVYTGKREVTGADIVKEQMAHYNVKAFHQQKQTAIDMKESILQSRIKEFGELLHQAWAVKCQMSSLVSNPRIDEVNQYCLANGALGGCIMGAGAGGYMLFMEHPEQEGELRKALIDKEINYLNIELDREGVRLMEENSGDLLH